MTYLFNSYFCVYINWKNKSVDNFWQHKGTYIFCMKHFFLHDKDYKQENRLNLKKVTKF
jgi:hypothetical protein